MTWTQNVIIIIKKPDSITYDVLHVSQTVGFLFLFITIN